MSRPTGRLIVAGKSDVGQKRTNNQDSFLVNESLGLFVVADGMGGHNGGEVASAIAVKTLEKIISDGQPAPMPQRMAEGFRLANRAIYEQARANPTLQGMGTTMTGAVYEAGLLYIGQVGDSRCYLFRDGELFQITEDHSQVYELLKAGLITEANLGSFHKNVITRSVGYEENVQVDVFCRPTAVGDRYLICSDGLTGMASNEQIAQILQNFSPEEAVTNLVDLANMQGGEDNVTAIVFEIQ